MSNDEPKPKDSPVEKSAAELSPNSAVDEFFNRMNYDMRRPKPDQDAVAAALQAIQRLGIDGGSAEIVSEEEIVTDGMCQSCGAQNRPSNKFCASCGVQLIQHVPLNTAAHKTSVNPMSEANTPGHHYHHHYHHHYFSPETSPQGEAPSRAVAAVGPRDAARVKTPLTGTALSRAETAVRKVTQDWALACNTTHLDDLVELYVADALLLRPNVPPVRGTASIREFLFGAIDAGLGEVELDPIRVEIFGDVAFEAGRCKMLVPTAAGKRREDRGKYMVVLTRQSGEWKIVSDCWSSDLSLGTGEVNPAKSGEAPGSLSRPQRKGF